MDLKKPYTLDEQIKKLKDHGVVISDDAFARNVLQKVSYYRLSGYMLQYRLSTDSHEMIKGIRFEDIYTVYCFDEYYIKLPPAAYSSHELSTVRSR